MLISLVSVFIVPPVSCLMLCLIGVAACVRGVRLGRTCIALGLAGLFVLAMPVTAKALLVSLEQDLPLIPPPDAPPGAIVVLGGDVVRLAGPPARADLGPLSLERVRLAASLWRATHLPILVTGGVLLDGTEPVAVIMARALRDEFGVPVRWIEPRAADTWDNATRSAAMLLQDHVAAAYLVTQPWHMRRALQSFARFDLTLTAAPTQIDTWSGDSLMDYLPRVSAWQISYFAFHEWIGRGYYALRR